MKSPGYLLCNRIRTPDGTVLESNNRHNYVSHVDDNGEYYFTDGGIAYVRRSVNIIPYTELDVYTNDPFLKIRSSFRWGTYGKDGKQKLQYKLLCDLSDDHIDAILETQKHIPDYIREQFQLEKSFRLSFNIKIED